MGNKHTVEFILAGGGGQPILLSGTPGKDVELAFTIFLVAQPKLSEDYRRDRPSAALEF
ncbi:MAG: hypothetical protein OYM47_16975 [Gemmatimonadota bacterium]|nr:hypothetical protein [Gemmatimonadota bacterium]